MKLIKISDRVFTVIIIILLLSIFLFGFGWMNSEVSYKYEVQDTVYAQSPLDEHQKDIFHWMVRDKMIALVSAALFLFTIAVAALKPKFNGHIRYS